MQKWFVCLATLVSLAMPWNGQAEFNPTDTVFEFETMKGVFGPYRRAGHPIRGIPGGVLPWVIDEVRGELRANGHVRIAVRGLVVADRDGVPPADRMINPHPYFRGRISCLTVNGHGRPDIVNVSTAPAPANILGDAHIEDTVDLPRPCIPPIVFVASPRGAWLAATGR